tara:strand:- start:269 stop:1396 length:1128 start_codon:yes stop_codon:yes gene_type:complete
MKYKSLQQVYGESVRGNVPPRRHLRLHGESYNVRYKREDEDEYTDLTVDDENFKKAARFLNTDSNVVDEGIKQLQETGLTEGQIKELIGVVYNHDEPHKFFTALSNQMTIEEFLNAPGGDILNLVASKYNLDKELVIDLLRFEPATKPSTGKGEVFMMVFIQNAKKGSVGDIDVNGVEFEIKGTNARIRGQRGFGAQTTAARTFMRGVEGLIKKSGLNFDVSKPNFNILVNSNGFIDNIANELTSTGKVSKEDIAQLYASGLKEVYENANIENDLLSWIRKDLNEDGTMKPVEFKKDYFLFALKYYTSQENFNHLVAIGTAPSPKFVFGKMRHISKEDIMNDNVLDKILPDSPPSFLPGAGAQGGQFSIKPNINR